MYFNPNSKLEKIYSFGHKTVVYSLMGISCAIAGIIGANIYGKLSTRKSSTVKT